MDASRSAAQPAVDEATPAKPYVPDVPDMSGSYDRYISSGLYDRRYPRPNRRTLRTLARCLPAGGRFLDFGGGTGRYTLPLLQMGGTSGVAYDICPVARRTMAERMQGFVDDGRLVVRGDDLDDLAADHPQAFDLVLLAFGVLAHVAGQATRLRLLRAVREMLRADGILLLSVPNAKRRFLDEQRAADRLIQAGRLEPGDILYKRGRGEGEIRMFYHLYTVAETRRELSAAGFRVESIRPESLLSERTVVHDPLLGWLDDLACRVAPASLGYDLLTVGRPQASGAPQSPRPTP